MAMGRAFRACSCVCILMAMGRVHAVHLFEMALLQTNSSFFFGFFLDKMHGCEHVYAA
jgi:hypothetical protein